MASAFIMTMTLAGDVLGPLAVGYMIEILGDLREAMIIVSFGALSLVITGMLLRSAIKDAGAEHRETALEH